MSASDSTEATLSIVFMGTPEAAVPTLKAIAGARFPVPLVITRPDRPKGRGRELRPSPVKAAAGELGLSVFTPDDVNAEESVSRIRAAAPDVLLVVAYGRILKRPIIEAPRLFPVNLHFSLLPSYRGAAPVARAIADGRTRTGVTVQRLVKKLDAGPVLARREVDVLPGETAGELEARLAVIGAELTVRTLACVARGEVAEEEQDENLVSYAPMLKKEDGEVDFRRSAVEIERHVRAMTPWPGGSTSFSGSRPGRVVSVTLLDVTVAAGSPPAEAAPGRVVDVERGAMIVATGEGLLSIRSLKPSGKQPISARDFVNGYHVAPGDRFGS